jgi:hypothetical protein
MEHAIHGFCPKHGKSLEIFEKLAVFDSERDPEVKPRLKSACREYELTWRTITGKTELTSVDVRKASITRLRVCTSMCSKIQDPRSQ